MKTYNNIYPRIYDFANLHKAYLKARAGKRFREEVLDFSSKLEENLIQIHNELINSLYQPSPYKQFVIKEPKERLILALPFKDRVVQHAICNIIEPIFEATFIKDSYACRKNKGVLKGVKRAAKHISSVEKTGGIYCLKMDIHKYFYSIDHHVIFEMIKKKIRCKKTLDLIKVIIDSSDNPGIPIGNLTSQLFANIYLSSLDHFIKEDLRVKYYLRYMDDMVIIDNSKENLARLLSEIKIFLKTKLRLELNKKTQIFPIKRGLDFLGYRQFRASRILRKSVMLKSYRKIKKFMKSKRKLNKVKESINGLLNICSYCKSNKVIENVKKIIGEKKWALMYSK